MSYTKHQLHKAIEIAVGMPLGSYLDLVTALRSAAVHFFINGEASDRVAAASRDIRQALRDIDRDDVLDLVKAECKVCLEELREIAHGLWKCECGSFPLESPEIKRRWRQL